MIPHQRHRTTILWSLTCFLHAPGIACAASTQFTELEGYFRMIWGLLVVLGIILLLYALLRKRFSLLASSGDKNIHIVEIKPLMGKKSLCLVRVKGQEILLGLSGDRIDHLVTLPEVFEKSFAETLKVSQQPKQP